MDNLSRQKLATSYFCTEEAESKEVDISHCKLQHYRGFVIAEAITSFMLIMKGVIVSETVGRKGAIRLADFLIDHELQDTDPKEVALNYKLKIRATRILVEGDKGG